jgi:thiamine-phosphate pyrophosphorylase
MIPDARQRLAQARLYLVCGALEDGRLDAALRGGVDIVQLRMKDADEATLLEAAERVAETCARHRVPFILNDRPDLVSRAQADGVHLGQDDLLPAEARSWLGPKPIIGVSTHRPPEIAAACEVPVDYIGVGPVNATPTKPGRPAVGTGLVTEAATQATVPFFAIGGIDATNVAAVVEAGARRIAVVRAIAEADDPERAARELRAALPQEAGVGAA